MDEAGDGMLRKWLAKSLPHQEHPTNGRHITRCVNVRGRTLVKATL